jgi:hypothetical protein
MTRGSWRGILSIAAGVMIAGVSLNAQVYRYPDRNRRNAPYYDEGRYGRQGSMGYGDPADVVQRVIRDMDLAARSSYVDRHEREHFERTISELMGFQDRWSRRRQVETKHLDRAVDNMKHLAEARQLDGRARRMIAQDIEILRNLRAQLHRYRD